MRLKKWTQNPILQPRANSGWEAAQVRNPAAILHDGRVHLLYTAAGDMDVEHKLYLGHAVSADGYHFERVKEAPLVQPDSFVFNGFDAGGIEDPRAVKIDDTIFITYCARAIPLWSYLQGKRMTNPPSEGVTWTKNFRRGGLLTTDDLVHFKRCGPITSDDHYDCNIILFPERIDGRYVMMHRPSDFSLADHPSYASAGISVCYSDDLIHWYDDQPILSSVYNWENAKLGGAAPPIRTEEGWLTLYHAVEKPPQDGSWHRDYRFCYRAGVVLLDLEDPRKVVARCPDPVLAPEAPFEKFGTVNNVVFPTGNVVLGDELFVYYGAADTVCCVAVVRLKELLAHVLSYRVRTAVALS